VPTLCRLALQANHRRAHLGDGGDPRRNARHFRRANRGRHVAAVGKNDRPEGVDLDSPSDLGDALCVIDVNSRIQ
jgi:hypothetical protein